MNELELNILESKITNIKEAKAFINELYLKGKIYHFDDDPLDCGLPACEVPQIEARVNEMFNLNLNWKEHEDIFGYALHLINTELYERD